MTTGQKVFWAVAALIAVDWLLGGRGGTNTSAGTTTASQSDVPRRGGTILVNTNFLGCRSMDDLERMISLIPCCTA